MRPRGGRKVTITSIVTDASGNKVSEMRYKAWGEVRYNWGATPTDYGFTGQYSHQSDFGLMFYNARYYDSALGRFASPDTIIPGNQGVQAWDRYAYTNNNPIVYTDPSGHCIPLCAIPVLEAAVVVATVAVGLWAVYDIGQASDQALQHNNRGPYIPKSQTDKINAFVNKVFNLNNGNFGNNMGDNFKCKSPRAKAACAALITAGVLLIIEAAVDGGHGEDESNSHPDPSAPTITSTPTTTPTPTVTPSSCPPYTECPNTLTPTSSPTSTWTPSPTVTPSPTWTPLPTLTPTLTATQPPPSILPYKNMRRWAY